MSFEPASEPTKKARTVPPEIDKLHKLYVSYFRVARTLHYVIGVSGLTFSLMATSGFGGNEASRAWALGAGVCFGAMGFIDPNSRYKKCVKAARILNIAILRYEYGELSQTELISAVEHAENVVTEMEEMEGSFPREATNAVGNERNKK
ncbi:hypothetical protein H6F86_30920 [Phormidium sp. FACHB-592]|uniref:DUF4231 domain-containing protein n=1 Tax=Stenomitos frigidus AS-A4 TaxID=2933935 RepID=A0ABV0KRT4_9CYAN|nr:hypothetical protein [Phormidium sp. FACHB-592]MBD2078225.1 hypothetical protein [Phormidium sp. FACHB-592]